MNNNKNFKNKDYGNQELLIGVEIKSNEIKMSSETLGVILTLAKAKTMDQFMELCSTTETQMRKDNFSESEIQEDINGSINIMNEWFLKAFNNVISLVMDTKELLNTIDKYKDKLNMDVLAVSHDKKDIIDKMN